jgi:hypothetical protein
MPKPSNKRPLNRKLENIIRMPRDESRQYAHHHKSEVYSKLMAQCILEADAQPGNFLPTLKSLIDCRLHVALLTEDDAVANALADFGFSRLKGKYPTMQSFTSIKKENESLEYLRLKIESQLFDFVESAKFIHFDDRNNRIYSREYTIPDSDYKWTYTVIQLAKGTIEIYHAFNKDVPAILEHLSRLWDSVLQAKDFHRQLEQLAEFEWWFVTTNVTARSGAGIGDALSLILQYKTNIPIRHEFRHIDWGILSKPLSKYIIWRVNETLSDGVANESHHH